MDKQFNQWLLQANQDRNQSNAASAPRQQRTSRQQTTPPQQTKTSQMTKSSMGSRTREKLPAPTFLSVVQPPVNAGKSGTLEHFQHTSFKFFPSSTVAIMSAYSLTKARITSGFVHVYQTESGKVCCSCDDYRTCEKCMHCASFSEDHKLGKLSSKGGSIPGVCGIDGASNRSETRVAPHEEQQFKRQLIASNVWSVAAFHYDTLRRTFVLRVNPEDREDWRLKCTSSWCRSISCCDHCKLVLKHAGHASSPSAPPSDPLCCFVLGIDFSHMQDAKDDGTLSLSLSVSLPLSLCLSLSLLSFSSPSLLIALTRNNPNPK
jgi:hypothetical protein